MHSSLNIYFIIYNPQCKIWYILIYRTDLTVYENDLKWYCYYWNNNKYEIHSENKFPSLKKNN